jgi:hypothetical protein
MVGPVQAAPDDRTEPLAPVLAESGADPAPARPPAGRRSFRPGSVFRGAARSLFVTPWFAAATGFVIAAALWVYSPHTVLRFPNSAPGVSLCKSAGCVQESDPQSGSLAAAAPGVKISDSKATARHADASHAARGLTFRFTVLWQRQNGFGAEVTVTGHQVPGSWRLSFDLPGAQIAYVAGVSWQANSAGNGGTASASSWQTGGDPGDYGFGADGGDNGDQGDSDAGHAQPGGVPVISFLITASGPLAGPAHCVFDHATCTFR